MGNKVVVITGSSRGIGKACALKLAKEGYNIVINYNTNEEMALKLLEEIKRIGVDSIAIRADVSNSDDVKRLIEETISHFGKIDILINNVGYLHDDFLIMLSNKEIDKTIDTNIKSCFYCCKEVAIKMYNEGKGKIINVSSISSKKAIEGQSLYSATKGAINSLTLVLAKELSRWGITVNAVAPGFVNTEMIKSIPKKKIDKYLSEIPLNRFAEAEEVADLISFLCSDKSNYITGQVITIDGGLSI